MSNDILNKLKIDNIFDTFNNIIYNNHTSFINSLKKTDQQSVDKHNQELEWEHDQGISDHFVNSLFQSINFFRSIQSSLKYLRITPSGYRNIVIRTFEFVAKTQFLSNNSNFSIIAQ